MSNGPSSLTLAHLIMAAIQRQKRHHLRFGTEALKYTRSIVHRRAPDLAEDLHEEVCNEAIVQMWRRDLSGVTLATAKRTLRKSILKAIRIVRAKNAPPGVRTRHQKVPGKSRVAAEHIGMIAAGASAKYRAANEGERGEVDSGAVPDVTSAIVLDGIEQRIDIQKLLPKAPAPVERALRLIHLDDVPVAVAAEAVGLDRFALARVTKAFSSVARAAA